MHGKEATLRKLEAWWLEGNLGALGVAIRLHSKLGLPLPEWVERGIVSEKEIRLGQLEIRWKMTKDLNAVADSIRVHTELGLPLPEWCVQPAIEGIALLREKGAQGQATPASNTALQQRNMMLCSMVILARIDPETGLPGRISLDEAWAEVAERFRKTAGRFSKKTGRKELSAETVRDAFNKYRDRYPSEQVT